MRLVADVVFSSLLLGFPCRKRGTVKNIVHRDDRQFCAGLGPIELAGTAIQ